MLRFLRFMAAALWLAAIAMVVGGFVTIMVIGHWPEAFSPVQNLFRWLHASLFSPIAWIIQIWLFIGPGAVFWWLANYVEERQRLKR